MDLTKCQNCAKIIRPGAQFCTRCGVPLRSPTPAASRPRVGPKNKSTSAFLWIFAIVASAAVLLLYFGVQTTVFPVKPAPAITYADRDSATIVTPSNETGAKTTFEEPNPEPMKIAQPETTYTLPLAEKLPDLILPQSISPARSIRGQLKRGTGLTMTYIEISAEEITSDILWTPRGDAFFTLTGNGYLSRIILKDFVEDKRINFARRCSYLALSHQGLLVAMTDLQEIWLLDPDSLRIKRRIPAPGVQRVLSSPNLDFALATSNRNRNSDREAVLYIDLFAASEPVREFQAPIGSARITPDGKYYFAQGGIEQLCSYRIEDRQLIPDQKTKRIAQNGQGISVSPDSKFVCLPSGGGNYGAIYSTNIYAVNDLSKPEFVVASGAYPRLVAFDPLADSLYTQNAESQLIVFSMTGIKRSEHKLTAARAIADEPRQFVPHPQGKKLLFLAKNRLLFVEFQAR